MSRTGCTRPAIYHYQKGRKNVEAFSNLKILNFGRFNISS
jgi:hypothetical protein